MSEQQQALAEQFDAVDLVEDAAPFIEKQDDDQGGEQSVEDQARALGWRPKDEFKGDPAKWTDATAFMESSDENLGFAKHQNKRLKEVNRDLNKKVKRMEGMLEQVKGFEQRAYQRALDELTAKQREAVQTGDLEAHDAVGKEIEALRKDMVEDPKVKSAEVDMAPIFAEWIADNDWYVKDEARRIYADAQLAKLGAAADYEDGPEAYLEKVTELVEARFAKKGAAQPKVNPVGAANALRNGSKGGKTYADLPADAKQMAQQMVTMKIFADKEAYAKEYFANG